MDKDEIIEAIVKTVIYGIALAFYIGMGYVMYHFIVKYW